MLSRLGLFFSSFVVDCALLLRLCVLRAYSSPPRALFRRCVFCVSPALVSSVRGSGVLCGARDAAAGMQVAAGTAAAARGDRARVVLAVL